MSDPAKEAPWRLRFVVTGFGPFAGVERNPSMALCETLESGLESAPLRRARLAERTVLEVSAGAVGEWTEGAMPTHCAEAAEAREYVVFLHFGVHGGASAFHVERCAYNEATFRVPDERGAQPMGEPIDESLPPGAPVGPTFSVDALTQRLQLRTPHLPCRASADPGRFVCNYTYFVSLLSAQQLERCTSLFVHVPSEAVVPLPQQLEFACAVMQELEGMFDEEAGTFSIPADPLPEAVAINSFTASIAAVSEAAPSNADSGSDDQSQHTAAQAASLAHDIATSLAFNCGVQEPSSSAPEFAAGAAAAGARPEPDGHSSSPSWLGALASTMSSFLPQRHKLVLLVRDDLNMGKGKVAAQCCHATLAMYRSLSQTSDYRLQMWSALGEAKVVLRVKDLPSLLDYQRRAREAGLPSFAVADAGRTQVAAGSITVLAIGPAPVGQIDAVTGDLKLL